MSLEYHEEDEGFHFDPTVDELINDYLKRKVKGEDCGDFIVEKDVYDKEPWLLDHTNNTFFKENEWYYFSERTQISEKKIGHGKYSKRTIGGANNDDIDRGNWSANGKEDIIESGKIIGKVRNLTYHYKKRDKNKKKLKRGDGASVSAITINVPGSQSSWIMDEYVLVDPVDPNKFQNLVLCKIHEIKKTSKNNEEATSTSSTQHHEEASTSTHHHQDEASMSTHHHESSYSLEHQPINEAHGFEAAIPEMLSYVDRQQSSVPAITFHHDEASTSTHHHQPINEAQELARCSVTWINNFQESGC